MEKVTVKKSVLLEKLQANRADHRGIFEEALDGYRDAALEILEGHIERVRQGKVEQIFVSLPMPEDHTKDYDRAIGMIEMSVDEEITLSEADFASYVQDDWRWKQQFLASNSTYSLSAAAALNS